MNAPSNRVGLHYYLFSFFQLEIRLEKARKK